MLEVFGTKIESSLSFGSLRRELELVSRETDTKFGFSTRKRSKMAIWKYFFGSGREKRSWAAFTVAWVARAAAGSADGCGQAQAAAVVTRIFPTNGTV